ncbi:MAG: TetR family transcriptional regulator, partial [Rhodothermales bacterium]|nr:TetR family transcriptional regulator [Rhodothermales bacterium]
MQVDEPLSMSRKERERLSRRTAMLEAAQSVFAERGFGQSTLDEIASRAEFGKG